jgi:hypothetical protein
MRSLILGLMLLRALFGMSGAAQQLPDFPLTLEIEKSDDSTLNDVTPELQMQSDRIGMPAALIGVSYKATLNGERHWFFSCDPEYRRLEVTLCTALPPGKYPALWVHNRELLWILRNGDSGPELRYLDAQIDKRNPPPPNDAVQNSPAYQPQPDPKTLPKSKQNINYPLLVHVYGSTQLQFPSGQLQGHTDCTVNSFSPYTTTVHCTQSEPVQLTRGAANIYASIDGEKRFFGCEAKWKWSKCSAIPPGFYGARWKDESHKQIMILGQRGSAIYEIGFQLND